MAGRVKSSIGIMQNVKEAVSIIWAASFLLHNVRNTIGVILIV